MKYFHQLTKKEYNKLIERKLTYGELAGLHPQPPWCNYPNATEGVMGCWSLMDFKIKSKKDCKDCSLFNHYEQGASK